MTTPKIGDLVILLHDRHFEEDYEDELYEDELGIVLDEETDTTYGNMLLLYFDKVRRFLSDDVKIIVEAKDET